MVRHRERRGAPRVLPRRGPRGAGRCGCAPGGRRACSIGARPPQETMRPPSVATRYTLIDVAPHEDSFAAALAAGLAAPPRSIPCRFLYDEIGSKLFEEIC